MLAYSRSTTRPQAPCPPHHHGHPVALKVQVDGGPHALAAHRARPKLHKAEPLAGGHHSQVLAAAAVQAVHWGAGGVLQGRHRRVAGRKWARPGEAARRNKHRAAAEQMQFTHPPFPPGTARQACHAFKPPTHLAALCPVEHLHAALVLDQVLLGRARHDAAAGRDRGAGRRPRRRGGRRHWRRGPAAAPGHAHAGGHSGDGRACAGRGEGGAVLQGCVGAAALQQLLAGLARQQRVLCGAGRKRRVHLAHASLPFR